MALNSRTTFGAAGTAVVLAIIASLGNWEGRRLDPYWDALGQVWTVCKGVTGVEVVPGRHYSEAECDGMEQRYVTTMLKNMGTCVHGEFEFYEVKAWGHFAYNVGTGNFCNSTAAKMLNEGKHKEACAQITRWVYAGRLDCRVASNKCPGIPRRRAWERATCEGST